MSNILTFISDPTIFINILSLIVIFVSIIIVTSKTLFLSIIYLSISSLSLCILYLLLDAPDVAMTEAALGASLSTVIFLNVLKKIDKANQIIVSTEGNNFSYTALIVCIIVFITFLYGFIDIADFGDQDSAFTKGISKYYIDNTKKDVGINSFVASILASYRGFDTLCETCVIFLSAISVSFILSCYKYDKR
jgi:multicomponent Na+:H+ antiporter subunit B